MIDLTLVLTAAAGRLAAAGVADYEPDGVYPSGATGVVLKNMPTGPDRVVVLNAYQPGGTPDPNDPVETVMLQLRTRGIAYPPTDVDDLAEAAVAALSGHRAVWPGLYVSRSYRISSAQLGADQNRRQERTDNLHLTLTR
ncbi:minor capsid protein [Litorihabitans aurantiacus]|uniref:Uncharacterized protein n=1 Tax=Litorihabitans aurantiacus TaxID=1930061 RepID=A0AA38CT91_9MICO|nr:minor capsid protein [Litorihabitans aurantiacus]GMA31602.1 hypothetical protein GCM10025875_15940 [Litorihabitans aurantiacus]